MGVGVAAWVDGVRDLTLDHYSMKGPVGTNNIAEWEALLEALKTAYAYVTAVDPDCRIRIYGDSQIIVNQFNGIYEVLDPKFEELYTSAMMYKKLIGSNLRLVAWIPRKDNKEADILSKLAITEYLKSTGLL